MPQKQVQDHPLALVARYNTTEQTIFNSCPLSGLSVLTAPMQTQIPLPVHLWDMQKQEVLIFAPVPHPMGWQRTFENILAPSPEEGNSL